MTLVQHLEELRHRLLFCVAAVVVGTAVADRRDEGPFRHGQQEGSMRSTTYGAPAPTTRFTTGIDTRREDDAT
jgi:hypothetical protein